MAEQYAKVNTICNCLVCGNEFMKDDVRLYVCDKHRCKSAKKYTITEYKKKTQYEIRCPNKKKRADFCGMHFNIFEIYRKKEENKCSHCNGTGSIK